MFVLAGVIVAFYAAIMVVCASALGARLARDDRQRMVEEALWEAAREAAGRREKQD